MSRFKATLSQLQTEKIVEADTLQEAAKLILEECRLYNKTSAYGVAQGYIQDLLKIEPIK